MTAPGIASAQADPAAPRGSGALSRAARLAAGAALIVAAAVVPVAASGFTLFQITMALVYGIAVLGLTLLTGVSGQISIGHGAFFAIGSYAAAVLTAGALPAAVAVPAAAAVSFACGFLLGLPAARLEGASLALTTFVLALAVPQIARSSVLEPWTGGVHGIVLRRAEVPFGIPLRSDQWLYYVTLATALALAACARNLVRSRMGLALLAVREHPAVASCAGVDVPRYRALAFGVSALYAGTAGALGATVVEFVAPDAFTLSLSLSLFVGMAVGGVGSIPGSAVGGLFVVFAPNLAERVSGFPSGALYGIILVLVVYAMPSGAAGLARRIAGCRASAPRGSGPREG